jgi:uncharacterized DUF497 family protein
MKIAFDRATDESNLRKHGLSLAFGARIFEDPELLVLPTIREADQEERYKAIGQVDGKLYTAVHVWRGETVRFLSVRRSNRREEEAYRRD